MKTQTYYKSRETIGRLAPSPTGLLHLGNAWSFLIAWLACRLEQGKIYLRMEDIDPQRSKKEFAQAIVEDLTWLGIDWDNFIDAQGKAHEIVWQSEHFTLYDNNLQKLKPFLYKCYCTRKELREMASAPQQSKQTTKPEDMAEDMPEVIQVGKKERDTSQKIKSQIKQEEKKIPLPMPDTGAPYTGKCRFLTDEERMFKEKNIGNYCVRLACPLFERKEFLNDDDRVSLIRQKIHKRRTNYVFEDLVLGKQNISLQECGGDFALQRSDHVWAYQLAVVSDDRNMGVNQIVRGNDILVSTPRQIYLYELLHSLDTDLETSPDINLASNLDISLGSNLDTNLDKSLLLPSYAHIPLLLDENGDRLAKRHHSLSLSALRERESDPSKVVTYLANLMGFTGEFSHAKALLEHIKTHIPRGTKAQFPWALLKKMQGDKNGIKTDILRYFDKI